MAVTTLLVAYHGDRWLPACIDSLVEASTCRMHLILVDNGGNSVFDTLDLDRFDCEIVKTPHPMGFAEANNYALMQASCLEAAVLFLNQDTISPPGWVDRCLDCFAQDAQLGAVSPLIQTYDGTGWDPGFLACLNGDEVLQDFGASSERHSRNWFYTDNAPAPALIVRTAVLQQVGPFDPVFGSYYEDYDLCRRIRGGGYKIGFCRSSTINHYSGSTTNNRARELKRMRLIIRNRLLHHLRASEKLRLSLLFRHTFIQFPRNLVRGFLRTPSSQPPLITLKAHWDLLRLAGRLLSRRRDEAAWEAYLREIGWPHRVPGLALRQSCPTYV